MFTLLRSILGPLALFTSALIVCSCSPGGNETTPSANADSSSQSASTAGVQSAIAVVSPDEFEKLLAAAGERVQLIDVRTQRECVEGVIPGAVAADISDETAFEKGIAALDQERPVMVYCAAGGRSSRAANKLSERGFNLIYDLDGGMNAWRNANKKTIKPNGDF